MSERSEPLPETVYCEVLRLASEVVKHETERAGEAPEASRARWVINWLYLLKPRRER